MDDRFQIDVQVGEEFSTVVDVQMLVAAAEETLRLQHISRAAITIVVADNDLVRSLNLQFRGLDAPTDVLTFANKEGESISTPPAALSPQVAAELEAYLGDVIIALPYAAQQAERFGNDLDAELRLLVIHGTLHLLGYDHATSSQEREMWAAQEAALSAFGDQDLARRSYDD